MLRNKQDCEIAQYWQAGNGGAIGQGISGEDFLSGLVERGVQQVLEAEMTSFLGPAAMRSARSIAAGVTSASRAR